MIRRSIALVVLSICVFAHDGMAQELSCGEKLTFRSNISARAEGPDQERCRSLCMLGIERMKLNSLSDPGGPYAQFSCSAEEVSTPNGETVSRPCVLSPTAEVEGELSFLAGGRTSGSSDQGEPGEPSLFSCTCTAPVTTTLSCLSAEFPPPADGSLLTCFQSNGSSPMLGGTMNWSGPTTAEQMASPDRLGLQQRCWTSPNIFGPFGGPSLPGGFEFGVGAQFMSEYSSDTGRIDPLGGSRMGGLCIKVPYINLYCYFGFGEDS